MKQTYVLLNRKVGNTEQRVDVQIPLEMIIPIKRKDGTFQAPKKIKDYFGGWAFKSVLEEGETILVNPNGGWNTLTKSDIILKMWQE